MMRVFFQKNLRHITLWLFVILVLALVVSKFYPYIFSSIPLGYDPGLYRYFFLEYFSAIPHIDYYNIASWVKNMFEPFLGYLGIILQLLGYSVDFLLSRGLAFFSTITSIYIYLILRPYSKTCARIGVLLFLLSIVQYQAFWRHYYKQILGIIFILGSLSLVQRKQYILSIPLVIAALTVQRPTGLFLVLTLLCYMIGRYFYERKLSKPLIISLIIGGLGALILYIPLFDHLISPLLKPLLGSAFIDGASGTFFTKDEFVYYALPYILLATYGFYLRMKHHMFDVIDAGFLIGILWTGLQLFFYNRMLIFTSIFFILVAAWTVSILLSKKRGWIVLLIVAVYQTISYGMYVFSHHSALISQAEFSFLQTVDATLPSDATWMVTHKNYSPRIVGYTMKSTIAPGLLDWNPRDKTQWGTWRHGDGLVKCTMLQNTYSGTDTKIYLRLGERQDKENLSAGNCFHLLYSQGNSSVFSIDLHNDAQ